MASTPTSHGVLRAIESYLANRVSRGDEQAKSLHRMLMPLLLAPAQEASITGAQDFEEVLDSMAESGAFDTEAEKVIDQHFAASSEPFGLERAREQVVQRLMSAYRGVPMAIRELADVRQRQALARVDAASEALIAQLDHAGSLEAPGVLRTASELRLAVAVAIGDPARAEVASETLSERVRDERVEALSQLQRQAGAAYTLFQFANKALWDAGNDAGGVDWGQVHQDVVAKAVDEDQQPLSQVLDAIKRYSPGAVTPEQLAAVDAFDGASAVVQNITLQLTSSERGFDDFDVIGHKEIHRVTTGHNLKRGDMFNVYGPEGTKRGATWQGSLESSLAAFLQVKADIIQVSREASAKRILAEFQPQAWIDDHATDIDGRVDVDVTEQVLRLSLERIHALEDYRDSTDELVDGSMAAIEHDGPFTVCAVGSICEYFGVKDLADITDDLLQAARANHELGGEVEAVRPQRIPRPLEPKAGEDLVSKVLEKMDANSKKPMARYAGSGYIVATQPKTNRAIAIVDGDFGRAEFKSVMADAAAMGLATDAVIVVATTATYSGRGIHFSKFEDLGVDKGVPVPEPRNVLGERAAPPFYVWADKNCVNTAANFQEAKAVRMTMINEGRETVYIVDADGIVNRPGFRGGPFG